MVTRVDVDAVAQVYVYWSRCWHCFTTLCLLKYMLTLWL